MEQEDEADGHGRREAVGESVMVGAIGKESVSFMLNLNSQMNNYINSLPNNSVRIPYL